MLAPGSLVLCPSAGSSVSQPGCNALVSESEQTHQGGVLSHTPFQSWETLELSGRELRITSVLKSRELLGGFQGTKNDQTQVCW